MAERAVLEREEGTGEASRPRVCPFLKRVVARSASLIQAYCQGYRDGRLRVSGVVVFREFCSQGRYRECPIYLSRMRRRRATL